MEKELAYYKELLMKEKQKETGGDTTLSTKQHASPDRGSQQSDASPGRGSYRDLSPTRGGDEDTGSYMNQLRKNKTKKVMAEDYRCT